MDFRLLSKGIGYCVGMLLLILDSKTALSGAQQGLDLCIKTIIPGLFPFFLLSILLCDSLSGFNIAMLRPLAKLCGIPNGCESILIPVFLGGYPSGAQSVSQAYRQRNITRTDAVRLLSFCNQPGPSFIFGILGTVFSETRLLWALWGIQLLSAFLCAAVVYKPPEQSSYIYTAEITLTAAMTKAIRITASVCSWIILFRVLIIYLEHWVLWILPTEVNTAIKGVLELSNGCCLLSNISDLPIRFILCSSMLSFGGVCVLMQTSSVIGDLPLKHYVAGKLLQTLFSILLSIIFIYISPYVFTLIPFLCVTLKKTVAFIRSMLYNKSKNLRRNSYAVSKKNRACLQLLSPGYPAGGRTNSLLQKRPAEP